MGFETSVTVPQGIWSGMAHAEPLFYDIVKEVRNQEWGYEQIISWKLQEILTLIQRRSNGMEGNVKSLTYCRRYIEENYMQRITVGELAGMTCYSPDRFRHLFTEGWPVVGEMEMIRLRAGSRTVGTRRIKRRRNRKGEKRKAVARMRLVR